MCDKDGVSRKQEIFSYQGKQLCAFCQQYDVFVNVIPDKAMEEWRFSIMFVGIQCNP